MKMKHFIWASAMITLLCYTTNSLNAQNMKKEEVLQNPSVFPIGDANVQYAKFFIGQSYLARLTQNDELNCPVSNVTFEPGCRNNWHSHTGGQILIAVGGRGYYQEKGKNARLLLPGDVVEIAPDVVHWHGAAPDSWFSHLAIECNPETNQNTWLEPVDDQAYAEATSPQGIAATSVSRNGTTRFINLGNNLAQTDPELEEIFTNFAFGETQQYGDLDTRMRILVTMASTIAMSTAGEYQKTLQAAFVNGVTPLEIKEVLYHAVPYVGMAKVAELISIANGFLSSKGVKLPLEPQAVITSENRMEKGLALQKSIFGERIDKMYETAPQGQLHFQEYLSANCFGDYQTRPVLDGHIQGNINVGNDKSVLLTVITQLLPYIGYLRTLNALACLNEIVPEDK